MTQDGDGYYRPGDRADGRTAQPVDLMGTTLGLIGDDVPGWSQGTDFSPALRGERFDAPRDVFLEMVGSPRWGLGMPDWRGLVSDRWKYAFNEHRIELLFDLDRPVRAAQLGGREPGLVGAAARPLEMLAETRDSYWEVLIEHRCGGPVPKDVAPKPGRKPYWLGAMAGVRDKAG